MRLAERTIVLLGEAVEASPATSFLVALQPSQLFHSLRMISTSFNMFNLRHLKTPAISKVTVSCDVSLVTNLQLISAAGERASNLSKSVNLDHRWPSDQPLAESWRASCCNGLADPRANSLRTWKRPRITMDYMPLHASAHVAQSLAFLWHQLFFGNL